jgi:thioredoxin reductase (NADPH)
VPQIFIGDRHVGGFDDLAELDRSGELDALLGRARSAPGDAEHRRLVIVGSGPSGYTAAIYAARAELEPVVIAGLMSGGQLMLTTDVENYPGFPEAVTGPELMERFQQQAERFGAKVLLEDATRVDLSARPFRVETDERRFSADAVIFSTGASAKWLGLPSEERLQNRGVSACATCDGALYRGKAMAVVGGGDTALEEALFLTRYATKVHVIHRREELRASKIMQDRALHHEKIEFVWNSVVEEVLGEDFVTGVRVRNVKTGEVSDLPVEALFVAIGHQPNTDLVRGQLELDDVGYVKVEPGTTRTSIEGVFASGDAMDPTYRQAVTAAGTGSMAAIDVERWLAAQGIE